MAGFRVVAVLHCFRLGMTLVLLMGDHGGALFLEPVFVIDLTLQGAG